MRRGLKSIWIDFRLLSFRGLQYTIPTTTDEWPLNGQTQSESKAFLAAALFFSLSEARGEKPTFWEVIPSIAVGCVNESNTTLAWNTVRMQSRRSSTRVVKGRLVWLIGLLHRGRQRAGSDWPLVKVSRIKKLFPKQPSVSLSQLSGTASAWAAAVSRNDYEKEGILGFLVSFFSCFFRLPLRFALLVALCFT